MAWVIQNKELLVAGSCLVMLIITVFARGEISISKEHGIQFKAGKTKAMESQKVCHGHGNCIKIEDFLETMKIVQQQSIYIGNLKFRLNFRQIEQVGIEATNLFDHDMKRHYLELLRSKGFKPETLQLTPEFKAFDTALYCVKFEIVREINRMVDENGFLEKEKTGQWNAYIDNKVADLIWVFNEQMDQHYHQTNPSRADIQEMTDIIFSDKGHDSPVTRVARSLKSFLTISKVNQNKIDLANETMENAVRKALHKEA